MSDTVEVIILAKDQATKTIEGVQRSFGGFAKGVGGAMATAGRVVGGMMLGVGAAAAGGFGLAMRSAFDMNASLEQSTMQFTTLMGDADKAQEHVAALFELGAKTPFETEPILQASKHLQVFGGEALNTIDNLTLVGDAAAAVGAPFDEVAFWVGRAYSAIQGGQPFGEAAMRLQELGLLTPEVRAEMEAMQDAGADVNDVWGVMTGNLENFNGAMEMQASSWAGLTSTLKDQLGMAAAEALKPFFDIAKEGLNWIINSGVIERVGAFFGEIATAVGAFVANLQEGMDPLNAFIEAIWDIAPQEVLDALVDFRDNILPGLSEAFHNVVDPVVAFIQRYVEMKDVLVGLGIVIMAAVIPALVSLVASLLPIIIPIVAIIGVVALLRNAWENNWGGIRDKLTEAWAVIQPILQQVGEWLKDKIQAAMQTLRAFWEEAWPAIQAKLAEFWAVAGPILQQIGEFIVNKVKADLQTLHDFWVNVAWPAIQRVVEVAGPIIQDIFRAIGDFITDTLIPTVQTLYTKWVEDVWPTIQTVTENVWEIIKTIFEELGRWINDNIVPWVEYLHDKWVEEVWPAIQQAIADAWEVIEPVWDAITEWLEKTIGPLLEKLQGYFETAMAGAASAIAPLQEAWDRIVGAVQGFWDWLSSKTFSFNFSIPDLPPWATPGSPLPIHTAWQRFADAMPSIGQKIADGFSAAFEAIRGSGFEAAETILDKLNSLAGLGSTFGGFFNQRYLNPAQAYLEQLQNDLANNDSILQAMIGRAGLGEIGVNDPMLELELSRLIGHPGATDEQQRAAQQALDLLRNRQQMLGRIGEQERLITDLQNKQLLLETQRYQLGFLQSQLDLLKLIKDNNLGADILEGFRLGLDADPTKLMDAMIEAVRRMMQAAEDELQIGSPSRWAQDVMGNVMTTLVDTARRGSQGVRDALAIAPARVLAPAPLAAGGGVQVNIDARGAAAGVDRDLEAMVRRVMREYGARAEIRQRTGR